MKLISLQLKNFKGIKSFELVAGGHNANVFGDNATGKTTLFDAFCWLLFDKDSQGKKDFEIKTLDPAGNVLHGLEHEVEAVLEHDGRIVGLRKVYAEKWTKKRGSATSEFTGHETSYFIDGVPVKKNEYVAKVAEIADEEVFKLLTSPAYFNEQLHWQKRRQVLLEICGDVSDADVIAADQSLAKLPEILGNRKLGEHRKVIAARRAELNKELEKIPTRIDEVMRGLPDITGLNAPRLAEDIAKFKELLKSKQETLLQLESGGEIAQKKIQLSTIEAELMALKNDYQTKIEAQAKEKRSALTGLEMTIDYRLKRTIAELNSGVVSRTGKIGNLQTKASQLREKWGEVNAKQFEFNQDTACPTCGQNLPEERLSEARAKAETSYNLEKAEKLAQISADGKAAMTEATELENQNSEAQEQIKELKAQVETVEQDAAKLRQEIEIIRAQNTLEKYPGYAQKLQEKASLESAITVLQEGKSGTIDEVRQGVAEVENTITALEGSLASIKRHEEGQKRIEELKAQEKLLAAEYSKLEGELYLTEQFIRTKVRMLEEKINSRFKYARFKLFDIQINGGVVECCETIFNGVPYSGGLNNAARINVGLDIINTLSEHYGFVAPIFIDNREAVTRLIDVNAQVVSLIVSESDKQLRVELEETQKAEVA